jgi:predicted O-methyltransferase YrrM
VSDCESVATGDPSLGALFAFLRPIAFTMPQRVTAVSAWKEHVPFALNLVAVLRPRTVVELGAHAGDSYCAMCQAVAREGLGSRCFAVDTWQGDEHSGRYGAEVLAELRAHHDPLYAEFSRLVQTTFDAARNQFADGSIDLLHIDGFHTYEAVKADLEGWLPKLSPAGVILLHDTNVRERDFGVWKVWEEVAARYPHFEFIHGHGLGVAAVGATPPPALARLWNATEEEATAIRAAFSALGQRVSALGDVRRLTAELAQRERGLADRDRQLAESEARVRELEDDIAATRMAATAIGISRGR